MQINKILHGCLCRAVQHRHSAPNPLWWWEHCCLCDALQLLHSVKRQRRLSVPSLSPPVHTAKKCKNRFSIGQKYPDVCLQVYGFSVGWTWGFGKESNLKFYGVFFCQQNAQHRMQKAPCSKHSGKCRKSLTEAKIETSDKNYWHRFHRN